MNIFFVIRCLLSTNSELYDNEEIGSEIWTTNNSTDVVNAIENINRDFIRIERDHYEIEVSNKFAVREFYNVELEGNNSGDQIYKIKLFHDFINSQNEQNMLIISLSKKTNDLLGDLRSISGKSLYKPLDKKFVLGLKNTVTLIDKFSNLLMLLKKTTNVVSDYIQYFGSEKFSFSQALQQLVTDDTKSEDKKTKKRALVPYTLIRKKRKKNDEKNAKNNEKYEEILNKIAKECSYFNYIAKSFISFCDAVEKCTSSMELCLKSLKINYQRYFIYLKGISDFFEIAIAPEITLAKTTFESFNDNLDDKKAILKMHLLNFYVLKDFYEHELFLAKRKIKQAEL
ncbi:hypothetical protein M153_100015519 [Pseudoloma neurophilia]|uniref:Uncharacterized protein n=1 Tax=Pseudoloma neurophilia TaxID=146866 RepID=A0A0R0M5A3_9MICR|nr:hypothetical protein M153_100015519 [Pseudoloma neurophilia]